MEGEGLVAINFISDPNIMRRLLSDLKSWQQLKMDSKASINLLVHGRSDLLP